MSQNIHDNADFFAEYAQLPRQIRGLAGAPEWPAVRAMLPQLTGRRIVNLGCGFGWFARWARTHGVAFVLGLDLSERMLDRAKRDTADPAIEYRIADLERLELPEVAFDLAYGVLALHYVEDFAPTPGQVADAPELAEEIERPMLLMLAACRTARR